MCWRVKIHARGHFSPEEICLPEQRSLIFILKKLESITDRSYQCNEILEHMNENRLQTAQQVLLSLVEDEC